MQNSLSLPRTFAMCASFTPHPTATSAGFFPSLFLLTHLPSSSSVHYVPLPSLYILTSLLVPPCFLSCRFSIDPQSDPEALFRITPDTGLITTAMELDREREHWHNITVIATQRGQRSHLTLRHHHTRSFS